MAQLSLNSRFKSALGLELPVLGLGTLRNNELEAALESALEAGYRLFDTAFNYQNEEVIGKVLNKWISSGKLKREDIFLTTKLPFQAMNAKYVRDYLERSLKMLRLKYVDLFLIHYPIGYFNVEVKRKPDGNYDFSNLVLDMETDHIAIWKEMEKLVDAGLTKYIGVSNFNISQIERLLKNCRIPPANLQTELQVYNQSKALRQFCREKGITVTSWATLGSPGNAKLSPTTHGLSGLEDPVVVRIAEAHGKTPAQVVLRHMLQLGVAVIPKSANPGRLRQNLELFDFQLSEADMAQLDALDRGEDGRLWDFAHLKTHPEYPFTK